MFQIKHFDLARNMKMKNTEKKRLHVWTIQKFLPEYVIVAKMIFAMKANFGLRSLPQQDAETQDAEAQIHCTWEVLRHSIWAFLSSMQSFHEVKNTVHKISWDMMEKQKTIMKDERAKDP